MSVNRHTQIHSEYYMCFQCIPHSKTFSLSSTSCLLQSWRILIGRVGLISDEAHNMKKLRRLPGMMMTEEGRKLAIKGWEYVVGFLKAWDEAVDVRDDGKSKYDWDSGHYL